MPHEMNQNPEQRSRDLIDKQLIACGWVVQSKKKINLGEIEGAAKTELTALVALIRKTCGIDEKLTDYGKTIDRNFQNWVFGKQAGALKFTEEQMQWLRMIKEHIADSFHIEPDDFELSPFDSVGGLGKMYQLFGDEMYPMIDELNEALAA